MKTYTFRVIVESEEANGYHGFVPLLRGVHTYGKTIEDIKKNLKEATICHVQGLLKDRESVPQEEDTLELIQSFSEKELSAGVCS